ncbi:MAG: S-methyl-5-thioribose-1-phosphate isomerase [Sphingomonadales bacterium]|nr:MAG: S-methyl-5-thioribose-1-phosphate isomerase [Sphingomonadales bacterium]
MIIDGARTRPLVLNPDGWSIRVLDQRLLPWSIEWQTIAGLDTAALAIKQMWVRGAPMLAVTGAYGICIALHDDPSDASLDRAYTILISTRPTAINLKGALDEIVRTVRPLPLSDRAAAAYARAAAMCDADAIDCEAIGRHGLPLIEAIADKRPGRPVNILTHCNAGALATFEYGTATAPIYLAHEAGIPVHVWVDETRPRNQGASLTAFELSQYGVPHTVISDNAGGLLMQRGDVDLCFVGVDRVTLNGDAINKVGTYLKALAAHDCGVPFYIAMPFTSFDPATPRGEDVPIEERSPEEVTHMQGVTEDGTRHVIRIVNPGSRAANPAFDMTPARLITGYITERGLLNVRDLANT